MGISVDVEQMPLRMRLLAHPGGGTKTSPFAGTARCYDRLNGGERGKRVLWRLA